MLLPGQGSRQEKFVFLEHFPFLLKWCIVFLASHLLMQYMERSSSPAQPFSSVGEEANPIAHSPAPNPREPQQRLEYPHDRLEGAKIPQLATHEPHSNYIPSYL